MASINPEMPINPLVEWEEAWTKRAIILTIVTVLLTITVVLMFTLGNLKEIAENFPRYRCTPLALPFASHFGYDTKENFNFCLTSIFNTKAAEVFGPVYNLLGGFTQIVQLIVDVALGIRKLFSNFLLGVNGFVRNVRDRIQGLLFNIRMSFMKLNNLMARVYGTMYSVIWLGTSALAAGFNLANNDLVNFILEFCFDPNTEVVLADGSRKAIKDIQIGEFLESENGPTKVTSVFRFDGSKTHMVSIDGLVLSKEHYVQYGGKWIQAGEHPDALPSPSLPELVCLNVEHHRFVVVNDARRLVVADYDEHGGAEVIRQTQQVAIKTLNGSPGETVSDYSLGIDERVEIKMVDGSWKPLGEIDIGEIVWNAGTVLGTVMEECESTIDVSGTHFSSAQIVFDTESETWSRASVKWPAAVSEEPRILRSLVTSTCGTLHIRDTHREYYVRDYREVAIPEMEQAYSDALRA